MRHLPVPQLVSGFASISMRDPSTADNDETVNVGDDGDRRYCIGLKTLKTNGTSIQAPTRGKSVVGPISKSGLAWSRAT